LEQWPNGTSAHIYVNTMAFGRTFPFARSRALIRPSCVRARTKPNHTATLLVLLSLLFDSSINRYQNLLVAAYWDVYVREKTADTILAGGTMAGEFTGMWWPCNRVRCCCVQKTIAVAARSKVYLTNLTMIVRDQPV
jgi:hypothetical protein